MQRSIYRVAKLPIILLASALASGCRQSNDSTPSVDSKTATSDTSSAGDRLDANTAPEDGLSAQASAVKKRMAELGADAKTTVQSGKLTEIVILDGSNLTAADISQIGQVAELKKLHILNCRVLNDDMAASLSDLNQLSSLALTNTVIGDKTVELIAKSFPQLTELDLSSNTNLTQSAMKSIEELKGLKVLSLVQNRFNDLSTRRLKALQELTSVDLRGNMEAGNMTLGVLSQLPKLTSLKHRSTAVTDDGIEKLSENISLQNLLIQDFMITSLSGQHLAKLTNLRQLEIFRCQGIAGDGVSALQGLGLERLTLRDLPAVDDSGMQLFANLPKLKRLYLHELEAVTDEGLKNLGSLTALEVLDIWSVPQLSDSTMEVIAGLPNLKVLSIRSTGITDAAVDAILKLNNLKVLTLKENGQVSAEAVSKLSTRKWDKLDTGN
jgi:Leucine-rich repeat (LRR) protein